MDTSFSGLVDAEFDRWVGNVSILDEHSLTVGLPVVVEGYRVALFWGDEPRTVLGGRKVGWLCDRLGLCFEDVVAEPEPEPEPEPDEPAGEEPIPDPVGDGDAVGEES